MGVLVLSLMGSHQPLVAVLVSDKKLDCLVLVKFFLSKPKQSSLSSGTSIKQYSRVFRTKNKSPLEEKRDFSDRWRSHRTFKQSWFYLTNAHLKCSPAIICDSFLYIYIFITYFLNYIQFNTFNSKKNRIGSQVYLFCFL